MKSHLSSAHSTFKNGCQRARSLKSIFDYLTTHSPAALNCDDVLRSSLVLAVSSFDLLLHDIFRQEVVSRLGTRKSVSTLRIPFDALIAPDTNRHSLVDEAIREENSYKSFVAPNKLAECLSKLIERPWEKIADSMGTPQAQVKNQLRLIVDLRNRIAHEADVNPRYGGVSLWPIYGNDVDQAIKFLESLGLTICTVIDAG